MKRISKQVMAGNVKIGGGAPVTVQSMLNVPSTDIEGSVRQAWIKSASIPATSAAMTA